MAKLTVGNRMATPTVGNTKPKKNTLDSYRLEDERDAGLAAIDQRERHATQMAAVNLERLKLYLPEQQRAAGLGGKSPDALIDAQNSYVQNVAAITQQAEADRNALKQGYGEKLREQSAAIRDEALGYLEMMYQDKLADSGDGKISEADVERLSDYVDNIDGITEEDRASLNRQLEYYGTGTRSAKEQEKFAVADSIEVDEELTKEGSTGQGGAGNNFRIRYGDFTYRVEIGDKARQSIIDAANAKNIANGKLFWLNGDLYLRENGTVFTVKNRYEHEGSREGVWFHKDTSYDSLKTDRGVK